MIIKKWLIDPEFNKDECKTTNDLLNIAGRRLDKAYACDIVGDCVFEGEDGKNYVGTVEFVIEEADPDYIKSLLDDGGE